MQTFLLVTYFTRRVAETEEQGSSLWGFAMAAAGLAVTLIAPVAGAVADQAGRRKPWLAAATISCCTASALLWFATPEPGSLWLVLVLLIAGTISLDLANVFYNAMLPSLVPLSRIGRWSGWGWGLGYVGGLSCLALALFLFVSPDNALFHLDRQAGRNVRAAFPLVAAWFGLFSFPLFLLTPDTPRRKALPAAVRDGLRQLARTFRRVRHYGHVLRFLVARMVYVDGLATLLAFAGAYAASVHGMTEAGVLLFGIVVNVAAGAGSFSFGWVDDLLGGKRTILLALAGLVLCATTILLIDSRRAFWIAGIAAGLFLGPVNSVSRSYLARLVPAPLVTEMFGLYALSGKATAAVGPFLVGWLTFVTGSLRIGLVVVIVFLLTGAAILCTVPAAEHAPSLEAETGD